MPNPNNFDYYPQNAMSNPNDGLFNSDAGFRQATYREPQSPYRQMPQQPMPQGGGFNPMNQPNMMNNNMPYDNRGMPPKKEKRGLFGGKRKTQAPAPRPMPGNPNMMPPGGINPQHRLNEMPQQGPNGFMQQQPHPNNGFPNQMGEPHPHMMNGNRQGGPMNGNSFAQQPVDSESLALLSPQPYNGQPNPAPNHQPVQSQPKPVEPVVQKVKTEEPAPKKEEKEEKVKKDSTSEFKRLANTNLKCSADTEMLLVFELLKGLNRGDDGVATMRPLIARAQLVEMEKLGYDLNRLRKVLNLDSKE